MSKYQKRKRKLTTLTDLKRAKISIQKLSLIPQKNNYLNIKRVRSNLAYEERKALAELKSMENTVVRIQDKESRFVLFINEDYENKVEHQIAKSSFKELRSDPSQEFERKIKLWIDKWQSNKTLSSDQVTFITPEHSRPGKMYGNIKTHKMNNTVRVITSGCNTAVESLSIFVEKELYKLA